MRITLGVTGGVAAYKAAELVRRLQQNGFTVQVVMTRGAREFITPLTFAALTGQKVITDLFAESGGEANLESAIEHIAVAQRTDLLLVAPATADILAKFARGIADDFLTTLYLASTAPVVVAPAMNVNMWNHGATQENVEMLRARGVKVVDPDEGYLACGMTGAGRLAGQDAIVAAVHEALHVVRDLAGQKVLVTAGPTRENVDPVRYFTNRSSGKMGYAIAEAAAQRGAHVILVSGPTALDAPPGVERIDVESAEEMHRAVLEKMADCSIAIFAAAVADYRPAEPNGQKIKRTKDSMTISLEPTPDILAAVARSKGERLIVGFAAETEHVVENARKKLAAKGADLIVANDVTAEGAGFDHDTNIVTLIARDGRDLALPQMSKNEVAQRILDEVVRLRSESRSAQRSAV
ncbi:MAG TPA: bifunctional phosphopantothenoylcysteine decarboxylase/phosphopantothenate--cysteine ligase CoaBC [Candidatus Saccharimonadales bacterium]|jgi:phosphopantothenoylcysteine decarboxylase/phosphopantothenate--cysteine ligase|nr:bifunctional phosphopantothenoylcysteine decarboxylase/phosphopantothenate--cysteine ligase CoaBC [Candidatus Saccharimonadales bacterium]